jgi:photosystem II stability/assembly factor-like uncharacterized protein
LTIYASRRPGTAGIGVGVFKSTDGGVTWRLYTDGLPGGTTNAVAFDPTDPDVVYAGYHSQDPQTYKSTDGGRHWTAYCMGVPGPMLFSDLVVDPTHPSTLYASNLGPGGVLKSTNAGRKWRVSNAGLPGGFVWDLALDPLDSRHLVTADEGVYESTDGAATWHRIGLANLFTFSVAFDPTDPTTIWAGTGGDQFGSGGLYKTTDGGANWRRVLQLRSVDQDIADIEVDPSNPSTVYVGVSSFPGAILKSVDGGRTWLRVGSHILTTPVHDLAVVPAEPSTIWTGTGDGAYVSFDAGLTWTPWSDGLRSEDVDAIVVDRTGSLVYAANSGGGVARLDVP